MSTALDIIQDKTLTYRQQVNKLAACAENSLQVLHYGKAADKLIEEGVICTLFEGGAPYRPRYVIPDYRLLMQRGCAFLGLEPPRDIWEATNALLIFYQHVPSITTYPVYLGNLDTLLEPFVADEAEAYHAIQLFLQHIDRTQNDSFVHANLGPADTRAGRLILRATEELACAIPNITLKYDPAVTPDDYLQLAARVALKTAKPSFANHPMEKADFGTEDYAIASCYNGFPIGGGGYTLVRLRLSHLAKKTDSPEVFLNELLPMAVGQMAAVIGERIRFLVEETPFFESSFLVKEGFIRRGLFSGMFGVVGLAEAVNHLLGAVEEKDRFGRGEAANQLGLTIIETLDRLVKGCRSPYSDCFDGHYLLHAQVGIDTDTDCSPGCRIPIGEEPELLAHILQSAPFHKYFFNGIGDIFVFEDTYQKHPEALVQIIKGAFASGLRYFSAYGAGGDLVRVTGYLAKRSEVEKLEHGEAVANGTTLFAMGAKNNGKAFDRRLRRDKTDAGQ